MTKRAQWVAGRPAYWPEREQGSIWTTWDVVHVWTKGIQIVLSLLIFTILVALVGGVAKTLYDVALLQTLSVANALRHVIIDALTLLALVEVFKTTLTYLSEGRVKVTFIVDTILVVMLTEVLSEWFQGAEIHRWWLLAGILGLLTVIRVMAVTFSPAPKYTPDAVAEPDEPVHLGV
ncbi:MAG: phosphate-starvation-inducible PsiE family protein [Nitrospiraceae bacterium]